MKCPTCKHQNDDKTVFCKNCGARLSGLASGISMMDINDKTADSSGKKPRRESSASKKIEGVLSPVIKASADIFQNSENFKRTLLVGICNIIPIINFASTGYVENWGLAAANKSSENLKPGIFEGNNMKIGFFEFIAFLVYEMIFFVASLIVNGLFGKIAIIGMLVTAALLIAKFFYHAFVSLSCMRTAATDNLGASFDVSNIWASYKSNIAQMFFLYFIPSAICKLAASLISLAVTAIFASGQMNVLATLAANYQQIFINPAMMLSALQLLASTVSVAGLTYAIFGFTGGIEKTLRYRALGHYLCSAKF